MEKHCRHAAVEALIAKRNELTSVVQPIASLRGDRQLGFEALLRLPRECPFASPADAFDAAATTPLLVDLELAALDTHLGSVAGHLPKGLLFVNLSAQSLLHPRLRGDELLARLSGAGLEPQRVVVEITELVRVSDPVAFAQAVAPLRSAGFRLAIDDFGCGFSNVRVLVELGPDYVKVDRSLVNGVAEHPRKRVFLESLAVLARRINCAVIGEGVETPEDVAELRACGVPFAQGFAVAAPAPLDHFVGPVAPPAPDPAFDLGDEERVGALAVPQEGVPPETPVGRIVALFDSRPEPVAVPVLRGGVATGLVTQQLLFSHLGHRYGFSLWNDRPVAAFVAANGGGPDRLPASASLEEAAELVRRRPASRRFDPLVVDTEEGRYHGLLPVDLLLTEMTRLKVEYALQSNPLTGLPGSLVLARAAQGRLEASRPFTLGWVDIDHFKSFNDRYGFTRGDEVLLLLAGLLRQHFAGDPRALVAHPGGDDFAFLAANDDAEERARRVAQAFSVQVASLYDPADRERGGIVSVDRRGERRRFGLVAVSVGLVAWNGEPQVDYRRLVEIAAEVKAGAKRIAGPAVVRNARALLPQPLPGPLVVAGASQAAFAPKPRDTAAVTIRRL